MEPDLQLLERLVVADITSTVVDPLTLERLAIVVIRTFLSCTLQSEGRVPWKGEAHQP